MHVRRNIRSFSQAELRALRDAIRVLQGRAGANGYVGVAGKHGRPLRQCQHHNALFLPWHRVYIHHFEWLLRQIDSSVVLPYWDWTDEPAVLAEGIPEAFKEPTYTSGGQVRANSLLAGPVQGENRLTFRGARSPVLIVPMIDDARTAMARTTYASFSSWMEGPHDDMHVWTGGDMSEQSTAAFDPLFWAHHCNVDRMWAIWQRCNPNAVPSQAIASRSLPGYSGWRVGHTLDISASWLDYSYDDLDTADCTLEAARLAMARVAPMAEGQVQQPEAPAGERIVAEVQDVFSGGRSFSVNVFVRDTSDPEAREFRVRTFGVFGAGVDDSLRPAAHRAHERFTRRVDITEEVTRLGLLGRPLAIRVEPVGVIEPEEAPPVPPGRVPVPMEARMLVGEARLVTLT